MIYICSIYSTSKNLSIEFKFEYYINIIILKYYYKKNFVFIFYFINNYSNHPKIKKKEGN